MRNSGISVVLIALGVAASCTSAPATQTSPAPQSGPPGTATVSPPSATGPGGAPRRAPNPIQQDSTRRAQVDSIMRTIAGRENEPAGNVFKNVKILKDMPAGEFLKNMDVTYGRGLGMGCGNCHVIGQYDGDTRKNKRVAREMQEMTDYINKVRLVNIKELDEDRVNISCVTCHAGSSRPRNTMAVPLPAAVPRN